jgi:hypothetical protein
MKLSEKIEMLLAIAEELKADIDKSQNFDSALLEAFEQAQDKVKDAANMLSAAKKQIERLREQARKIAMFDEEPQDPADRPTLHGWFYLQPLRGEYFNPENHFCRALAEMGKRWGITFKEMEPIVQVLFLTHKEDIEGNDGCWQNGDVPQAVVDAVGGKATPCYLPLSMVNAVVVDQRLTLHAQGADIEFNLCPQGHHGDMTLEQVRDAVVKASGF